MEYETACRGQLVWAAPALNMFLNWGHMGVGVRLMDRRRSCLDQLFRIGVK